MNVARRTNTSRTRDSLVQFVWADYVIVMLLTNFFWPELDLRSLYFQQDGATCYTSRETFRRKKFSGCIISGLDGELNWFDAVELFLVGIREGESQC